MWVGLLIFYVANEANVANVFCRILSRRMSQNVPLCLLQKPYLCTEFQSAMKSNQLLNYLTYQLIH